MSTPRAVVVRRRTEYDELLARHGTLGQAEFFLRTRGQSIDPVRERHERTGAAVAAVLGAIPAEWRRAEVERDELPRFLFEPGDVVAVVGQDGLVANVAKYLHNQPVIGFDPLPGANPGVLVPHDPGSAATLFAAVAAGRARIVERTTVVARTDDGQELRGLNEVYVGQPGHQSARYDLAWRGRSETQSSSGVIVGTGTGATGWCASIARASAPDAVLPSPDERGLAWFVREAWPSPTTGTTLTAGALGADEALRLRVSSDSLVVFADGLEADRLLVGWGQEVSVGVAERGLRTVA
ncbi:inorganic polyphosphate kinase [Phycicoccus jejuensis]|uniref:inorganic polyphosphate kinase n=1 Tax=Phycicoccus jejuensis TaxID=367299 RepID=UPI0004C375B3|nr:inorganic polyphosphate kinase [Phycicoccus jejuensis]